MGIQAVDLRLLKAVEIIIDRRVPKLQRIEPLHKVRFGQEPRRCQYKVLDKVLSTRASIAEKKPSALAAGRLRSASKPRRGAGRACGSIDKHLADERFPSNHLPARHRILPAMRVQQGQQVHVDRNQQRDQHLHIPAGGRGVSLHSFIADLPAAGDQPGYHVD